MAESTTESFAFRPRLVETLKNYSSSQFTADLIAGLTVGIVALPLALAFAIASGVAPSAGLYTAIIAGFLISALGGSRVQIGGPTGAFVAIVFGVVAQYGLNNLVICTIMAGFMLLIMGFARMGTMIKFIPYPVTTGFTSGIAVLILSTQIRDFLGLKVDKVPADFVDKLRLLGEHWGTLHRPTLALAACSLAIVFLWPKNWARRVPGSIIAMGPGIKKGLRLMGFSVSAFDIAPTLLHLYGIEPPKQMRGRVITEIFEQAPTQPAGAGK